jgi:DNA polymerase-3 subunit delta'
MSASNNLNLPYSTKLVGLDKYFNEMTNLYEKKKFPKVLLLNGKKGIGKFTLIMHFINYVYSKNEPTLYDTKKKIINVNSSFYNLLLNKLSQDIFFIQAEESKNIKIDDIRTLKKSLMNSSLSTNPRFIIIDEVEFLNHNSANALLKTLEEPTNNNFFILINSKQTNLLETISSRCLKSNIFLSTAHENEVINYLIEERSIENVINLKECLTPGLFLKFNEIYLKYQIRQNDTIFVKLNILINGYKKEKDKLLISLVYFSIDYFFLHKIKNNENYIELLFKIKTSIIKIINDFVQFNLNINSVLNLIKTKLKNV